MEQFVEECRKEWKRLGVPEAAANEMAADLEVDLAEARGEGASPEEVLGNGVFDPRAFARSWAVERGVVAPESGPIRARTSPLLVAAIAFAIVAAIGGGLVIGARGVGGERVFAAPFFGPPARCSVSLPRTFFPSPSPGEVRPSFPPNPGEPPVFRRCGEISIQRLATGGLAPRVFVSPGRGASDVGWILLILGLAGVAGSALLWWVVPSRWSRAGAHGRSALAA